jgi:hypothetical protein
VVPQTPAPAKKAKQVRFTSSFRSTPLRDVQTDTEGRIGRPTPKGKGKGKEKEKDEDEDEDVVEMAVEIPAGNVVSNAGLPSC